MSPDALLLGLHLLASGSVPPRELADHLRAVAEGDAPDHLVALQERLLADRPELAAEAARLTSRPFYVPVYCGECRARFRISPGEAGPEAHCPLCGEPMVQARGLAVFGGEATSGARAAEAEGPYAGREAGQAFAHFELLGLLGRGGAGRVYEARNLRTGRRVALKLLAFEPLEPAAKSFARLQREARVAASIVHENVVPVFDMGVAEGVPYIEMELVRGSSLMVRVRGRVPPPAAETCRICTDALAGLAELHRHRIAHGDVKPANILLDEAGRARLTDFGISRFLEETTSASTADRLVGSPHFMSPEQWRGERLSPATDLYAMGLVLYFALTGRLPYEGEGHLALMYAHLHTPLLEPGLPVPGVPDYLADVVRRATEKLPAQRFASADDFASALRLFTDGRVS